VGRCHQQTHRAAGQWLCATDDGGTTYTAGAGITIVGGIISSTLTAGAGITLTNDVISSTVPHPANVVWVAKSGGDFTGVQAALNSITDAADGNRYVVKIAPGVYTGRVTMKPYVDIEGSGELTTKLTTGGSRTTGTVVGANNAELRFLTVENTGGDVYAIAIYSNAATPRLTHVTATASGGIYRFGVYNTNYSSPTMTGVTATAAGGTSNYGVYTSVSSYPTIRNSALSGSTYSLGGDGGAKVAASMLDGTVASGHTCFQNYNASFAPVTCP